jgi:hypothetical protein
LGARRPQLPSGNTPPPADFRSERRKSPVPPRADERLHGMAIMPNLIGAILSHPAFSWLHYPVFPAGDLISGKTSGFADNASTHGEADRQEWTGAIAQQRAGPPRWKLIWR